MIIWDRQNRMARKLISLFFFVASLWAPVIGGAQTGKELIARGQYIFEVAGGCACHTVPKETPDAGGRAFPIPFGTSAQSMFD